jgi:hypothetical protein
MIWKRTFKGPKTRKKSLLLVCSEEGCEGRGTIETLGFEEISGWTSESTTPHVSWFAKRSRKALVTVIADEVHLTTSLGDTQSVILHARAATDIP